MALDEPICVAACGMLETSLPIEIPSLSSDLLHSIEEGLYSAVISLRREHNSRTLPSKLPLEMLIHVFIQAREVKDTLDADSHLIIPPPDYKTLLSLTHVCHLWRSTAVAAPTLWNHVPKVPARISEMFVQRSGSNVPLTIHHNFGTAFPWDECPLQPTMHVRLRSLILNVDRPFDWPNHRGKNALHTVAPHLRYLAINSPVRSYRYGTPPVLGAMTLFGGVAPALTALTLTLHTGVLYTDAFPALAHLRIAGTEHVALPAEDLLAMLAHTPTLETLYVRNTSMRRHHDPAQPAPLLLPLPVVRLARLRVGSVDTDNLDAAFTLAQHLRIPRTGTLQLHRIKVSPRSALARVMLPPAEQLGPLDVLEIVAGPPEFLHVRTRRPEGGGLWLEFYTKEHGLDVREKLLVPVVQALGPALVGVRTLRVFVFWQEYKAGFLAAVLDAVAPHIAALETLVVATPNHNWTGWEGPVRDALAPRREGGGGGEGEDVVPLPNLSTIGVEAHGRCGRIYEPFVDVLRERAAHGHRLERLVIHGPPDWQKSEQDRTTAAEAEGLVGRVEHTDTALWVLASDPAWRAMNEHWVLFPRADEEDCYWAWGGLNPGKHR